ncbi:MAG: Elongation factor 4 [Parcubacteria group bacterium GW2011_GWF1_40_6]|uniref:Elongation factor 4 n=2 Tax=Candidatus Nomuraibacteriota TaxID=1752729 RepID=A0A0G0QSU2_9BACT|nr:MAG: Elongation factor 4 [Candidatus Nomurabacteria bacterium GW2011_GWF2_40_12]KKR69662.1 MAG: Elongation factor 4 [Parcubacteria group bacterium GW2011_GWF1_40_6]OGJ09682.1 MAG: elongation factor 4 [Candidatus Nomurabacteria bacterium RIFOXYB1_FULL_39_16]OGJ14594.1 MAG: elongation factor 4 [Candidatus Nomurabacteria bacterium RIFOXYD1_FULL_39_12]
MDLKHIRNFSIIAHIDHGKSTLADRMLEITHTIETRKMRDQVLDSMDLERERGITIKMQPVRMEYNYHPALKGTPPQQGGEDSSPPKLGGVPEGGGGTFVLNLIDTPGHIDFSYEVSRALKAVEGSILLIDSTQGVQAQTLTTLAMAREGGLKIIPVLSKIDSPLSRVSDVKEEVVKLLNCNPDEILLVSGRTGEGVESLLQEVIKRIPEPKRTYEKEDELRALVFDFKYSNHRGVIVFVRVLDGRVAKGDTLLFAVSGEKFTALEVGTFSPEETPCEHLSAGETGYIVTGIKKPGIASVGDTITMFKNPLPAFPGYMQPMPVVWASVFPEDADDFAELKLSLGKLKLSDSAFSYEEESSGSLGKGFRCGFLGMLHLEIITERLKREFNLKLVITTPSITYEVIMKNGKREKVYSPYFFPDDGLIEDVFEPWVDLKIITPVLYIGNIMQLLFDHEGEIGETDNFGDNRSSVSVTMPLRELMRNFFDELKSTSSGYGSISYKIGEMRKANVTRLDVLVADEVVPAFSRVVSKKRAEEEAEKAVEKLAEILPRQMFTLKIQGRALGRIISSRTLSGMKKDVTQHMYGGDITRKMKLREKQKKGKKKMKEKGKVNISQDIFLKMMRNKD